jgi:hypothetical protein
MLALLWLLGACDRTPTVPVNDATSVGDASATLLIAVRGRGEVAHPADQGGATSCSTVPPNPEKADCVRAFASGTAVALQARPAGGFAFDHYGGACAGKVACTVTMNERRVVEAIFKAAVVPPASHTLRILVRGRGEVTHTADLSGAVSCAPTPATPTVAECTRAFAPGSEVVLLAVPAPGFTFNGWAAPCAGTGPCTVKVNENRVIEVKFAG